MKYRTICVNVLADDVYVVYEGEDRFLALVAAQELNEEEEIGDIIEDFENGRFDDMTDEELEELPEGDHHTELVGIVFNITTGKVEYLEDRYQAVTPGSE